jgi:hypothetical protein
MRNGLLGAGRSLQRATHPELWLPEARGTEEGLETRSETMSETQESIRDWRNRADFIAEREFFDHEGNAVVRVYTILESGRWRARLEREGMAPRETGVKLKAGAMSRCPLCGDPLVDLMEFDSHTNVAAKSMNGFVVLGNPPKFTRATWMCKRGHAVTAKDSGYTPRTTRRVVIEETR